MSTIVDGIKRNSATQDTKDRIGYPIALLQKYRGLAKLKKVQ
ncbi:MAG: hypothetical protein PHY74_06550 [Candidatus Bathyarchaeota archaeon]|nr:hypothetical protein [Candidatus Bathyarchaeota archaeon]MDI9577378.1 hypothetical protein [Thermoproteota archaeon]